MTAPLLKGRNMSKWTLGAAPLLRSMRLALLAGLLWLCGSGSALAALVVNSVTVNGSTTPVQVGAGTMLRIAVTVTSDGTRWWSTAIYTSTFSSMNFCSVGPDVAFVGTRTFVFDVAAPTQQNLFTLVVAAHSNNNCNSGGQRGARSLTDMINTRPVSVGVDHLQIEHDGSGRTCGAKTITFKACANVGCSSLYTPNTTVTLNTTTGSSWNTGTLVISGGTGTAQLTRTSVGSATIGGVITNPAPKTATVCLQGGVAGDCTIDFSDTSCSLDAVEVGKATATPIFTKRTGAEFKLDVLTLNGAGALANSTSSVTATLVDDASCVPGATVTTLSAPSTLTYTGNSRMTFAFTATRASKVARVRMTTGTLSGCSYDKFAVRPASFTMSTPATGGAGADALGAQGGAAPAIKAGSGAFTLLANTPGGYTGSPGFSSDRVGAASVNATTAGVVGDLAPVVVNGGFGAAASGAASSVASGSFTYSEVGYFKLLPFAVFDSGAFAAVDAINGECVAYVGNLADGGAVSDPNIVDGTGKIGCYFGNTESQFFGRFIPDRFVFDTASIANRTSVAGCTASPFTYLGEEMRATVALTAVNSTGGLTANYAGIFNRFSAPATQLGLGVVSDLPAPRLVFPICGATASHPCFTVGTATSTAALGVVTFNAPLTLFRPTAAVGPYEELKLGVAPADLDAVRLDPATYNLDTVTMPTASTTGNHLLIGTSKLRFGRMNIDNAYGSELLNLSMKVSAQYWNGKGYSASLQDNCTPLLAENFELDALGYRGGITDKNMLATNVTAGTAMAAGVGRMVLKKPTSPPTTKGSAVLRSKSLILPGSGRATFGVYKAGPVIYMRETY